MTNNSAKLYFEVTYSATSPPHILKSQLSHPQGQRDNISVDGVVEPVVPT